jgi:hypothetical protein
MSRMSPPTPLYSVTRPEDINALNQLLTDFALDNRARINAVLTIPLIKAPSSYTKSETVTLKYAGYPFIVGMVKVGTGYAPLPYIDTEGGATMTAKEVIRVTPTTNTDGTISVTVKLDCDSRDHGNTLARTVYLLILRDKQQ